MKKGDIVNTSSDVYPSGTIVKIHKDGEVEVEVKEGVIIHTTLEKLEKINKTN